MLCIAWCNRVVYSLQYIILGLTSVSVIFRASLDGIVRIWETETGNCALSLAGHREPVYSVSYSPDAKFIATGSSDRCVNIWSTQVCTEHSTVQRLYYIVYSAFGFNSLY